MSIIERVTQKPTAGVLIIANLLPIFGVLFFDWEVIDLLLIYWAESLIIGLFGILKMLVVAKIKKQISIIARAIFYCIHYGFFMYGHLVIIFLIFAREKIQEGWYIFSVPPFMSEAFSTIWLALIFLFISHAISFFVNFIGKKEFKEMVQKPNTMMFLPYKRIYVMHLSLLFGGFLVNLAGSHMTGLILFIILKIILDTKAHLKEHGVNQLRPTVRV